MDLDVSLVEPVQTKSNRATGGILMVAGGVLEETYTYSDE
eukprot:CAMPEP_0194067242 /NCGR_PEP_ID=MMETSP0009_2-20130614/86449_1 /TAXON_ID=210454 /ORGANISM="Grammatophora oceanica, Strain CCMP 410" /LENGTH=39 /DNA_ID= /DNA_START= /DNA_END= /DNA_ORIENTATION=